MFLTLFHSTELYYMKLEKVLDQLNSFEKNSFLKILDGIISQRPIKEKEVDAILAGDNRDLKNVDNLNIVKVFNLLEPEFTQQLRSCFERTQSQFDLLIDILSRDGNCVMKYDWFSRLYEAEIHSLVKSIKSFNKRLEDPKEFDPVRRRDYLTYKACLKTAYHNDEARNDELKVTEDESSILTTLAESLDLSQEEVKLINYDIVPLKQREIDDVIDDLKGVGALFFSKKNNTVFVADEIVRLLRKVRNRAVADKYFRRVLKQLREPQINLVCKTHGIDWRQDLDSKIKAIIKEGISFKQILSEDVFKPGTTLTERKAFINDLCEKKLLITPALKGATLDEKVSNLIEHFNNVDREEKIGISMDGYDQLLRDIKEFYPEMNHLLKSEFEIQEEDVLVADLLIDYNIKPKDVLELMGKNEISEFCKQVEVSTRGNEIANVLEAYKDSENLFLENFEAIAQRDHNLLKENGIVINDADIGLKFEELTSKIFEELGFSVDEDLKRRINTKKDKIDILLNVGGNEVILVECKTAKDKNYNKFSAVSRQLKSYYRLALENDLIVRRVLLIGPDFTDDFVNECGMEIELEITLIKANSLRIILEAFRASKHKKFPDALLTRDLLIQEERIVKAINR